MTPRELEEYRALRETIRERSTARLWMVLAALAVWSALTIASAAAAAPPAASLVPLFFLAAAFEVVFSIHTAVERVGRYIQVFHEPDTGAAAWEHTAMALGRRFPGGGMDALFSPLFALAALLNFLAAMTAGPVLVEWVVLGLVHLAFVVRIVAARRQAARQRAIDLDRFQQLKDDGGVRL